MQGADQGPQQGNAEDMLKSQFSEQAFNILRAKFPQLIGNVVTFKTLSADLEKGSALGAFVIEAGKDLVYIPVTMSDGANISCEMVYNKEEDQFLPLDNNIVKEILAKSTSSDPTIMSKDQRVEDTRGLFRNMMRPPASSNVILAGEREGISALPNRCKEALTEYLTEKNPELLGKVASFYDVEYLATQLIPNAEPVVSSNTNTTDFISIDRLTKAAAEQLSEEERERLLADGFLAKEADETLVVPEDNLKDAVVSSLFLQTYKYKKGKCNVSEADLVFADANGISKQKALLCGSLILNQEGAVKRLWEGDSVLVSDLSNCVYDLSKYKSVISANQLLSAVNKYQNKFITVYTLVPGRNGYIITDFVMDDSGDRFTYADNTISCNKQTKIVLTDQLKRGYICINTDIIIVPAESKFIVYCSYGDTKTLDTISSIDQFLKITRTFGNRLVQMDNGAGLSITEEPNTTQNFRNTKLAAEWLHNRYGMGSEQIHTVLNNRATWVFEKKAYVTPEVMQQVAAMQQAAAVPQGAMPQGGTAAVPPNFDQLQDFAELEDPDMFDMGVLSTFAEDPDIKSLLVEYLPDFMAAEDKIGRILLLFASQKKEIEEFYGSEKCAKVMNSCRKIFTILGELVSSLKTYINMV